MEPDGWSRLASISDGSKTKRPCAIKRRIEQGEIRGISEHALIQGQVVADMPRRPDPHLLAGVSLLGREVAGNVDRA